MARVAQPLQFAPIPTDIGRRQQLLELADALNCKGKLLPAVGAHTLLWAFVCSSDPRKNGRFGPMSAESLAHLCCWPDNPEQLLSSFIRTGIIVVQPSGDWRLDGWEEHAGKALKNRKTETVGKRTRRAKERLEAVGRTTSQSLSGGQVAGQSAGHPAGPFARKDQDQVKNKDMKPSSPDDKKAATEEHSAEVQKPAVAEGCSSLEPNHASPSLVSHAPTRPCKPREGPLRADPMPGHRPSHSGGSTAVLEGSVLRVSKMPESESPMMTDRWAPEAHREGLAPQTLVRSSPTLTPGTSSPAGRQQRGADDAPRLGPPQHKPGDDVPLSTADALIWIFESDPAVLPMPVNMRRDWSDRVDAMAGVVTGWDITRAVFQARAETLLNTYPGCGTKPYTMGKVFQKLEPIIAKRKNSKHQHLGYRAQQAALHVQQQQAQEEEYRAFEAENGPIADAAPF